MEWADDVLCGIESAADEAAVFDRLQRAAEELGFDYCAYGMRLPVPVTRPQTVMLNSYPRVWQERYAAKKYLEVDPTVWHGRRSQDSIIWSDEAFQKTPELWNDAQDIGLRVGWAKSSLDGQGVGGMLTLARSGQPLTKLELDAVERRMRWLTNVAHQGFRRVHAMRRGSPLSSREREVLRWAADGKTLDETSAIMEISVATVKFHTRNAAIKLGTVNRTAAVARAAVLGLLSD